jgi:hypothetical protein
VAGTPATEQQAVPPAGRGAGEMPPEKKRCQKRKEKKRCQELFRY